MPKVKGNHLAQIADYENCKAAICDALRGKARSRKGHKNSNRRRKCMQARIKKIKTHLQRKAWRLKTVIETGAYKPPKMHEFYVCEGSKRKWRHITVPDLHSQFIHHAVFNVIAPIIERRNYYYDCGNVKGKGTALAIKQAKALFKDKRNKYYGQFDVAKYYDSIPHKPLIWRLRNRITKDKDVLRLLWAIIKSSGKNGVGLAIGFYSSQYFAVFYLQGLDYKIKQEFTKDCGYVRYVDDGVIVGSDKRVIKRALQSVALYLIDAGLKIKGIWQVREIDRRLMHFLGYRFGRGYTILDKTNMLKISRDARYAKNRRITPHRASQLISHYGRLKWCDSYKFRKEHFDKAVNIKRCREIVSNESKRKQRAA